VDGYLRPNPDPATGDPIPHRCAPSWASGNNQHSGGRATFCLEIINNEIHTAIHAFHSWRGINDVANQNKTILDKLNSELSFWITQLNALQTIYFIVLGRIFNEESKAHYIDKLLVETGRHPEFFSKESLAARKAASGLAGDDLKKYLRCAWEPTAKDFRQLRKMVGRAPKYLKEIIRKSETKCTPIDNSKSMCAHFSRKLRLERLKTYCMT
jgi:hypothetical protein